MPGPGPGASLAAHCPARSGINQYRVTLRSTAEYARSTLPGLVFTAHGLESPAQNPTCLIPSRTRRGGTAGTDFAQGSRLSGSVWRD
ncbi:uncharacterized protein TrAtP1_000888 [Trichoderma atroviride]|uniref:uncharacterized protein n=1 Tax=Hypocrea atroviridis TaxID=63577 RepID=UPI003318D564|nr:hypothetical protein TrAtP1_000888 [Trichoderma atroviride]